MSPRRVEKPVSEGRLGFKRADGLPGALLREPGAGAAEGMLAV